MTEAKKKRMREIQEQRLKMFAYQKEDHYEEKKVGNEWYIKSWNGGTQRWQVSVYSEVSYRRYKSYTPEKEFAPIREKPEPKIPFVRPTLESIKKQLENDKR